MYFGKHETYVWHMEALACMSCGFSQFLYIKQLYPSHKQHNL